MACRLNHQLNGRRPITEFLSESLPRPCVRDNVQLVIVLLQKIIAIWVFDVNLCRVRVVITRHQNRFFVVGNNRFHVRLIVLLIYCAHSRSKALHLIWVDLCQSTRNLLELLVPPDNVSFQQVNKLTSFLFFFPIYDIFPKNLGPCSIVRECWVEILVSTARPLDELAVSKRKFTLIPAAFISLILIIPVYLFFFFPSTAISRLR